MPSPTSNTKQIKVGDTILVNKGVCGKDMGVLVSVDGVSVFGQWGTYRSSKTNENRVFDLAVHTVTKLEEQL